MGNPIIETRNLKKTYYKDTFEINALEGIDLRVDQGDFVSFMGPSGSGKSTLLNLIAGFDNITSGKVIVDGTDISALDENALAKWRTSTIGFIFQFYNLIPVLTAYENIELPLLLLSLSKEERKRHIMTALRAVGLERRAGHYPRQMSGGEEQRIAIARSLVTDPKIVLADEPTGNLDEKTSEDIVNLMLELNKRFNKTFVIVTHDPKVAKKTKKTLHLYKGSIQN